MSNRKKTIIISAIVAFLVLVASFFGYRAYRYHDFVRRAPETRSHGGGPYG